MKEYTNKFCRLIYDENDSYKDALIETLNTRLQAIADFFGITELEEKIIIKIYYTTESFKASLIPYCKYYDWIIGHTYDGNVNKLSFNCYDETAHKGEPLKSFLDTIVHEIVHKMHHITKGNNHTENGWFHEALAVNLSNQEYIECSIDCTLEDLKNNYEETNNAYHISAILGRYLLQNYSHDFIISMCKDETILDSFAPIFFEEVKKEQESKIVGQHKI